MRRLAVLSVIITACSPPNLPMVDFMGEVAAVEFGDGFTATALGPGGPDTIVRVGPMTITLTDGTSLAVAAGTPGGNLCLSLIHPSQAPEITGEPSATIEDIPRFEGFMDWTAPCVVMGRLGAEGRVEWYRTLETVVHQGRRLAVVGDLDRFDTSTLSVVTRDGLRFPRATGSEDCRNREPGSAGAVVLADWVSGQVVATLCYGSA